MSRWAITQPNLSGPGAVQDIIEWAQWAESKGFDDLWLGDAGAIDALTLSALLLQNTERLRIGIAVVPVYTRTPAVLAATVATLHDIAPGRFVLGLGSSSETMITRWHGMAFDQPLTRVRETVSILRQALAGEKTVFEGETLRSVGYRQPAVVGDVPIMLAALGPKMIRLAVSESDGVILNLFPVNALPGIMAQVRAAQPGPQFEVGTRLQALITDDLDAGRNRFRYYFAPYYASPVYNLFLASAGYERDAEELLRAARRGDWQTARAALSDRAVDEIAVIGSAARCRERIEEMVEAGIDTPMVWCMSTDRDEQFATYEALAPVGAEIGP
jgi:probable F420-dependent oxidoreductase